MKIINAIAHIFSIAFIPLLIPTYAMILALWGTYLDLANPGARMMALSVTFVATALIPLIIIYVMYRLGLVRDPGLNERKDRFVPVCLSIVSYVGVALFLSSIHSPEWLSLFLWASAAAALTMLIVSFWWKISGHATGVGGLVAFSFVMCYRNYTLHNNIVLLFLTLSIAGIVCTSRLILQRHTLGQVVAGFFNGVIWITLAELLLSNY